MSSRLISGIILKGIGSFYDAKTEDGIIRCRARGRFRKEGIIPMVGDHITIRPGSTTSEAYIEEILPRKNTLARPAVSNIDHLGVVAAFTNPPPDLLLVDKLLIAAELNDISPFLIFNKIDLVESTEADALIKEYEPAGYPIFCISGKRGIGIDELSRGLQGITTLAGQSGVGKSSIINKLHPSLDLETGDISEKLKRGKHTTRHVELLSLPYGGMIVDTPGFSQMDVINLEHERLQDSYPEFQPYVHECKFNGCIHHHEPQCAVQRAVEDGLISKGRYDRYTKLLEDIKGNRRDAW